MEVICLEDKAFFSLIDRVHGYLKDKLNVTEDRWITPEEAMRRLNISSRTTLQKMRDEGKIRFTQPERKIILYDAKSIDEFLEENAKDRF